MFPTYINAKAAWKYINARVLSTTGTPDKCIGFIDPEERTTFRKFFFNVLMNRYHLLTAYDNTSHFLIGFAVLKVSKAFGNMLTFIHVIFLEEHITLPKNKVEVLSFLQRIERDLFVDPNNRVLRVRLSLANKFCDIFDELRYTPDPKWGNQNKCIYYKANYGKGNL